MNVVAIERPAAPPRAQVSWGEFLRSSLDPVWRPEEWDGETWTFAGQLDSPMTNIALCLREGCGVVVDGNAAWCSGCRKAGRRAKTRDELAPRVWGKRNLAQAKPDKARRFCLAGLRPSVRDELLFALQEGDRQTIPVRPLQTSLLAGKIPLDAESLLDVPDTIAGGLQRSLLRSAQRPAPAGGLRR